MEIPQDCKFFLADSPIFGNLAEVNTLAKIQVRDWLLKNGRDRQWLAQHCGVKKDTVNQWFSHLGFPSAAVASIRALMKLDDLRDKKSEPDDETALIQFSAGEFERIERARLGLGYQSRPEMYRDAVLDYVTHYEENEDAKPAKIVRYDDKKPVKVNRVAEGGNK